MTNIYIDTDALVALHDISDSLHTRATKILKNLVSQQITPYLGTNILLETLTIISQRLGKNQANELLNELRSGKYKIITPDNELTLKAEEIFRSVNSKNISYSDCLSFAIAKEHNIKHVFSFDIHFKQQGLIRVGVDS